MHTLLLVPDNDTDPVTLVDEPCTTDPGALFCAVCLTPLPLAICG